MSFSILNFIYPKSCCICSSNGYYICPTCKKLFRRNLPECHVCRRLSPFYLTHKECKKSSLFDGIFVAWEYNEMCSRILKSYKYKNAYDISATLSEFFVQALLSSSFVHNLKDTLLIPLPISFSRRNERGFNQMDSITEHISHRLDLDISKDILFCKSTNTHQAQKSREERITRDNPFYINNANKIDLSKYRSITIVDDVITTGATLNMCARQLSPYLRQTTQLYSLCLFRGACRTRS